MESVKHFTAAHRSLDNTRNSHANSLTRLFNKQAKNFESARFGWMAILITIQSCLGAVACMYILKGNSSIVMLAICACITMGNNALFIALAKPKVCLIGFYISIFLNTIFILQNL